ncbi:uncharacterized protein Z518_10779 [Rhinocladiella mackenziei CBS 650.93]|uniref:Zn(2)-C6 fungal-type domain-containing protein n=1 Tax=Rhinocladiella mackenziei CBS 650.93 TaxID=1442369 RepID=A0A0D2FCN4_9EURO|nr:uncharacterized protein Z518_10779 [Rhinocladiella mackenziei CBS 650.93]KIW99851.1 hypothetical protein Z518_10779 [Rhinocladiella mackenziei CBS 650.93]
MLGQHPAQGPGERTELVKRRKVAVACDLCRERKRKCDGERPQCGPCARRIPPSTCVWSEERSKYASYIESLESRIKQLENSTRDGSHSPATEAADPSLGATPRLHSKRDQPGLIPTVVEGQLRREGGAGSRLSINRAGTRRTASHYEPGGATSISNLAGEDHGQDARGPGVDAMGTSSSYIMRPDGPDHDTADYFGPSSTSSFLGLVRLVISKSSDPLRTGQSQGAPNKLAGPSRTSDSTLRDIGWKYSSTAFHVPPRREAEALLANYWTRVYTLYPILHRPTFTRRYHALWQESQPFQTTLDDVLFHCMLNAIFALGAHFQPELEPAARTAKSESFFHQCQHLLTLDLLAHGNLEMVQALLLMAQYLQSTDKPNYCWSLAGLAMRMAQAIGLHLQSTESTAANGQKWDQVELEVRRRVWGMCILLDRVLSMTYGRPLMMHPPMTRQSLVYPSMVDDEFLTRPPEAPGRQPEGIPSVIASYSYTLRLQEILGEILSAFYSGDQSSGSGAAGGENKSMKENSHSSLVNRLKAGDFQDLFRLDASLSKWHNSLPRYLKTDQGDIRGDPECMYAFSNASPPSNDGIMPLSVIFSRQANALWTRWLHLRIFLFRPALLIVLDRDQDSFAFGPDGETSSDHSVLHQRMLRNLADLCVSAAEDLLDVIYSGRESEQSSLPAWWFNVFCQTYKIPSHINYRG